VLLGVLVVEEREGDVLVHLWDASICAKEDFTVLMLTLRSLVDLFLVILS
jgi:hypothetical protein